MDREHLTQVNSIDRWATLIVNNKVILIIQKNWCFFTGFFTVKTSTIMKYMFFQNWF